MSTVLLIGEAMGLFIAEEYGALKDVTHFSKGISGAELNVAVGLSRLGHNVKYITRFGKDSIGKYIYNFLKEETINTEYITFDEKYTTGLQIKNKVKSGDPETEYFRKNSAFSKMKLKDIETIDFNKISLLHVTGIPLALSEDLRNIIRDFIKQAKEANCSITFDPNIRPSLWPDEKTMIETLNEFAGYADVIMPGVQEAEKLSESKNLDEIVNHFINLGAKTVIIKDGEKGAYYKTEGENSTIEKVAGFKVEKIVDTVGAGDGFAVGVISSLLEKETIEQAVTRGNTIGAIQVQHKSDNDGLPNKVELQKYL